MNEASSDESTLVSIDVHSDKPSKIDAICMNCNKRLSMHLKITATRHVVNIVNYGYYDMKTVEIPDSSRKSQLKTEYYRTMS
jgi:hypothetical protein